MQITKLFFDVNQAACRDIDDPEIFFKDQKEEAEYDRKATRAALKVCESCPVIADCFQFAFTENAVGVWGETTTFDRRKIFDSMMRDRPVNKGNMRGKARDNSKNLDGHNDLKKIEKGAKMVEELIKALALDNNLGDTETIKLARLKIKNPSMSYKELADETGLTRDQVSGKLRRFIGRFK